MRDFAKTRDKKCAWCGQPGRFVYWWESDSNQSDRPRDLRPFCGIDCWNSWRQE